MRGTVVQVGHFIADKYRVKSVLGQGGMGVVYLAHHELLHKDVAVKVLTTGDDDTARERFVREGRAAARLKSRHVVNVSDIGTLPDGDLFLVMEHLVGRDLDKLVQQHGPMPVTMAVDVVLQVLDVLAEAHHNGIVHRALKPANIFLCEDGGTPTAKVLDFGISKTGREELLSLTSTAAVMGSPLYMSPEQAKSSKAVDHRADIWSIGVVLYEVLTGTTPFSDTTIGGVFAKIYQETPAAVSTMRGDVPPALATVIARCLAKNPVERFRDCAELAQALAPFGSGARNDCVTRAASFRLPGGATAVLRSPSDPRISEPGPATNPRERVPSSPQFPAHVVTGAQTAEGWGQSERDLSVTKPRTSTLFVALAAGFGTLALVGIAIIAFVKLRAPQPTTTTDVPTSAPAASSAPPPETVTIPAASASSPLVAVSAAPSASTPVKTTKPVNGKVKDLSKEKY